MSWICGPYDPSTQAVHVYPDSGNHTVYTPILVSCWCHPRFEVQESGAVVVIHEEHLEEVVN